MHARRLAAAGILLCVGCGDPVRLTGRSPVSRSLADEAAIISEAIDSLYGGGRNHRLVVRSKTQGSPTRGRDIRGTLAAYRVEAPEATDNFLERNTEPFDLRALSAFHTSTPIEFATDSILALLTRGNPTMYWRDFYRRYPDSGGLITVSRPGLDRSGTQAVLHIGRGCGGRCGSWGYALLRKKSGRWTVERYVVDRVS